MAIVNRDQRSPVEAWLVESLRLTAFPSADAAVTPETWWKDLLGQESATQTIQRAHFTRQEQGEWEGGILTLSILPGRIDWTLSPKVPQDGPPSNLLAVGSFSEIVPKFIDLILRWIPSCPKVDRLALGVNALMPVPDQAKGYGTLATLLPSVQLDAASSDFRYQVNRPRPTRLGVEGLKINRLAAWSVMRMELVAVTVPTRTHRSAPLFACRAEIDINTSADFSQPLPPERLPDLVREFLNLGAEILAEGDRP
jgi:hypothetical protein